MFPAETPPQGLQRERKEKRKLVLHEDKTQIVSPYKVSTDVVNFTFKRAAVLRPMFCYLASEIYITQIFGWVKMSLFLLTVHKDK